MILSSHDLLLRLEGRVYSIIPLASVNIVLFISSISSITFHQVTLYVSRTSTEMAEKAVDVGHVSVPQVPH
jgi:hypothetical protein